MEFLEHRRTRRSGGKRGEIAEPPVDVHNSIFTMLLSMTITGSAALQDHLDVPVCPPITQQQPQTP
jgi:hypothetical protein